jgi:FkbM family methyltransferase
MNAKRQLSRMFVNSIIRTAASICEQSPIMLDIIRKSNFKGKARVANCINPKLLPKHIVADCRGIRYKLDLLDDGQLHIYFDIFEREEIKRVYQLLPKNGVCIDVGANIGFYALHFAKQVGPNGTVHAFEPDPICFAHIIENSDLNNLGGILKTHQIAVANFTGHTVFYRSYPQHSGWGSLVRFKDIESDQLKVPCITLDTFIESEGLGKVDFLKVDVEGSEFEVLEGAQNSLKNRVFEYILIEFNGLRLAELKKTFADFLEVFAMNRYRPYELNLGLLEQLKRGSVESNKVISNFLFVAN